jgi:flagellar FliL protein
VTAIDTAEKVPAKTGRKKTLLLGLFLIVAGAGAAWFFLLSGQTGKAEEPAAHGEVVNVDPIAVNLAGGGYLRIGLALHLTEEASGAPGEETDTSKALDLTIAYFSQANPVDVAGAREALKVGLQQQIVEAYEGDVLEIYYTDYVTQ